MECGHHSSILLDDIGCHGLRVAPVATTPLTVVTLSTADSGGTRPVPRLRITDRTGAVFLEDLNVAAAQSVSLRTVPPAGGLISASGIFLWSSGNVAAMSTPMDLAITCGPCVMPSFSFVTPSMIVGRNGVARLRVEVDAISPFRIEWYRRDGPEVLPVGIGNEVTVSVSEADNFFARVIDACGTAQSNDVRVSRAPARRRAVGR